MNANEYKLQQLSEAIKLYENENSAVKDYLTLKQERDEVLNECKRSW